MGIKISSLPNNALPYTGSEKIPLVQDGQTRGGTLSSFVNYLSGALLSDSELRALSGNWQNTYTTFRANSANYAVKDATNTFSEIQIFNDLPQFNGGILVGNVTTIYEIPDTVPGDSYTITMGGGAGMHDISPLIYERNTLIGVGAGFNAGYDGGRASNIVAVGNNACDGAGGIAGTADYIVAVGYGAAATVGSSGIANHIVAIGTAAAGGAAAGGGTVNDIIAIGRNAGAEAGYYEGNTVTDIIAIGRDAGRYTGVDEFSVTTSENNIFIGLSSGYTKQGSRNTFVGDLTNTSPTSATSLSGCIALGYGAVPTARNTIAIGSASTPLSVVPGRTFTGSLSGLRVMINGTYYTIPLLA